jgi:hypothetical protein
MSRDNHLKEERRQGMRYNDTKREINIVRNNYMRFQNSTDRMLNGRALFEFDGGVKTLKLAIVILAHLFYIDDQKVDFIEKKLFSKAINSIAEFSLRDKEDLLKLINAEISEKFVFDYITRNELSDGVVKMAIEYLKSDVKLYGNDSGRLLLFTKHYNTICKKTFK